MPKYTKLPIPKCNFFIDKGNFGLVDYQKLLIVLNIYFILIPFSDDAGFWSENDEAVAIGIFNIEK